MRLLRGQPTPREGAGKLPGLILDQGWLPYQLPVALGRNASPQKKAVVLGKGMHHLVSEKTPDHHVLYLRLYPKTARLSKM